MARHRPVREADGVDLDEKTEREMNVFLNNASAMGTWDLDGLEKLLADTIAEDLGFDNTDLQLLFDSKEMSPAFANEPEEVRSTIADIESIKADRKRSKERAQARDDAEFFVRRSTRGNQEKTVS